MLSRRNTTQRGEKVAFYGALETNDSAVKVLGDKILGDLARDLADTVRRNTSIDWTLKESVRAKLRVLVKRTLVSTATPPPTKPSKPPKL